MGNSFRSDRVAVEIQREINDILRNKVRDPRVQDVNITDVQLTGDLSQATVYYSLLLGEHGLRRQSDIPGLALRCGKDTLL